MDKTLKESLERANLDLAQGERAAEASLAELRMQAQALFFKKKLQPYTTYLLRKYTAAIHVSGMTLWSLWWKDAGGGIPGGSIMSRVLLQVRLLTRWPRKRCKITTTPSTKNKV